MLLTDSPVFAVGMMIAGLAAGTGFYYCRLRKENLPGIAALWAALELSKRPEFAGKTIVALLPDTGERYLSTWLFE